MPLTLIAPQFFRQTPWKNGGGVSLTLAEEREAGSASGDWHGVIWQFGRTAINEPGPFSDLSGFDRLQTVVAGQGLVLETSAGEIDLRVPLTIARYDGGLRIKSRLEGGAVEVVNLIARRALAQAKLQVLNAKDTAVLPAGHCVIYAFGADVRFEIDGSSCTLPAGHAASANGARSLVCLEGSCLVATVFPAGAAPP